MTGIKVVTLEQQKEAIKLQERLEQRGMDDDDFAS
jgi:hypothetical protein